MHLHEVDLAELIRILTGPRGRLPSPHGLAPDVQEGYGVVELMREDPKVILQETGLLVAPIHVNQCPALPEDTSRIAVQMAGDDLQVTLII